MTSLATLTTAGAALLPREASRWMVGAWTTVFLAIMGLRFQK
jgi:hypothetical protein